VFKFARPSSSLGLRDPSFRRHPALESRLPKECLLLPGLCELDLTARLLGTAAVATFSGSYNGTPAVFKTATALLAHGDGMDASQRRCLLNDMLQEAYRMSPLCDLHLEQFNGVVTLPMDGGDVRWLVCEGSSGGTLAQPLASLVKVWERSPWDSLWTLARGLFRGLAALHMHQPVVDSSSMATFPRRLAWFS
jgi:hypothetical protein